MRLLPIALFGATCASALAQSFTLLNPAPGHSFSTATAMTPDGSIVAGRSSGAPSETFSLLARWQGSAQPQAYSAPAPNTGAFAAAVSHNGNTIVGSARGGAGPERAAIWTSAGGFVHLPLHPLQQASSPSAARAVSADGAIAVGWALAPANFRAVRWIGGTIQDLGLLPGGVAARADAITADGGTIYGIASAPTGRSIFRWTQASGMEQIVAFPTLNFSAEVGGISADGSVIIGHVNVQVGEPAAFRFAAGALQAIPVLPGTNANIPRAITAEGSTVIGQSYLASNPAVSTAFIWTPATGTLALQEWLQQHGVQFGEATLVDAYAVSPDGATFAGIARLPSGYTRGFVATIPAPAAASLHIIGAIALARRRRR